MGDAAEAVNEMRTFSFCLIFDCHLLAFAEIDGSQGCKRISVLSSNTKLKIASILQLADSRTYTPIFYPRLAIHAAFTFRTASK